MRKLMTKEVTTTTVQLAKMEMVDGSPVAVALPQETLLGNVSLEKAQKEMSKKFGAGVTVFQVVPNSFTYEMPVEDFVKVATIKIDEPEQQELIQE
jgi:hypothetical protein